MVILSDALISTKEDLDVNSSSTSFLPADLHPYLNLLKIKRKHDEDLRRPSRNTG